MSTTQQATPFQEDLRSAINRASKENASDTPDWILARYLSACLEAYDGAVASRERWYGRPCGMGSGLAHNDTAPDPESPTRQAT